MDQPERRGTNCLLGGNSKQHALFGLSCNFDNLELPFSACIQCQEKALRYLTAGNFSIQMDATCRLCYGFSLSRVLNHGKYIVPMPLPQTSNPPGCSLTDKPGLLTFELLGDAWHYAIRMFVHTKQWHKEDVKSYFTMLCINNNTVENFIQCCCNYLLVEDLRDKPNQYNDEMVAYVKHQRTVHPLLYQVPPPRPPGVLDPLASAWRRLCICP